MTTQQHIELLENHLQKLLANAEKRTQGRWHVEKQARSVWSEDDNQVARTEAHSGHGMRIHWNMPERAANATFIASCAGNAEAGWRSTLEFICTLRALIAGGDAAAKDYSEKKLYELTCQWPIELIQEGAE